MITRSQNINDSTPVALAAHVRYRNFLLERYCAGNFRTSTKRARASRDKVIQDDVTLNDLCPFLDLRKDTIRKLDKGSPHKESQTICPALGNHGTIDHVQTGQNLCGPTCSGADEVCKRRDKQI